MSTARLEVEAWFSRLYLPGGGRGLPVVEDVTFGESSRRTRVQAMAAIRDEASRMLAEHGWRQTGVWTPAEPGSAREAWTTTVEAAR